MRVLKHSIMLCSLATALAGEPTHVSKFLVDNEILFYDTESKKLEKRYIHYADISNLREVLQANPRITELVLNSEGGQLNAALEMGRIIADFKLITSVGQTCLSACVILLAAGRERRLKTGASVGLQRPYWRQADLVDYYSDNKDSESWDDIFEFSEWLYDDAQLTLAEYLNFMLGQEIDFRFLLASLRYRKLQMWYPARATLMESNLITTAHEPSNQTPILPDTMSEISMR